MQISRRCSVGSRTRPTFLAGSCCSSRPICWVGNTRGRERSRPLTFLRDDVVLRPRVTFLLDALFVSVGYPPSREVIRREVHRDSIPLQNPDVILAHLPADVRQHLVPVLELLAEGRVRKHFADRTHHLYRVASHARCRSPSPVVERECHSRTI